MTISAEQQGTKRAPARSARRSAAQAEGSSDVTTGGPVEPEPGVQPAYREYQQARKSLASAFRGRVRHDRAAIEHAERRYRTYDEAMDKALKNREKAERDALIAYAETLARAEEQASEVYHQRMKQALKECQQAIAQAWKESTENSGDMANVFADDKSIPSQPGMLARLPRPGAVASGVRRKVVALNASLSPRVKAGARKTRQKTREWKRNLSPRVKAIAGGIRRKTLEWRKSRPVSDF